MNRRIFSISKHVSTILCLASATSLSGCVTHSPVGRIIPRQPDTVLQPAAQAAARYDAARARILAAAAHIHPDESPFQRAVRHLQSLGYLPITHAFIHGQNHARIRHDAFLWPVPVDLQKTADEYAWNAQNPFIRGAVIQFERENGILGAKGTSKGRLHKAVIAAVLSTKAKPDPWAWKWVLVAKADGTNAPERLHVWTSSGGWIWRARVNTGVLGATPNGTWPIVQRLPSATMRGVFPVPVSRTAYAALKGDQVPQWAGSALMRPARGLVNGHPVRWQPYSDPGIKWVNYFDAGIGIHYYPRAAYGFPQSAGCVEEPLEPARITYGLLHYGVPVTVSRAGFPALDQPFRRKGLHPAMPLMRQGRAIGQPATH